MRAYRRTLSAARSSRPRKVLDASWRAQIAESPSKRLRSENFLDPCSVPISQYIAWFKSRSRRAFRASPALEKPKSRPVLSLPADMTY
jgi:hypothetical protein